MSNIVNDRRAVLNYLLDTAANIKLSTAAVIGGVVQYDYVVIHEASPVVIKHIVTNFVMVTLTADGLLIPTSDDNDDEWLS